MQTSTPAALVADIQEKCQAPAQAFLSFQCPYHNSLPCQTIFEIPLSSLKSAPQAEQPLFPAPAFYSQGPRRGLFENQQGQGQSR